MSEPMSQPEADPDNLLLRKFVLERKEADLNRLIASLSPRLRARLKVRFSSLPEACHEEIVQDVFIKLSRDPKKIWDPCGDSPCLAFTILSAHTYRRGIDKIRKAKQPIEANKVSLDELSASEEQCVLIPPLFEDHSERPSLEAIEKLIQIAGVDKQSLLAAIKDPNNWKVGDAEDAKSKPDYPRIAACQGTSVNTVQKQLKRIREAVYKKFGGSTGFMLALRTLAWIKQNLPRILAWSIIVIALLLSVVLIQKSTSNSSVKTSETGVSANKTLVQTTARTVNGGQPTAENNLADQSNAPNILATVPTANDTLVNTNSNKLKFKVWLDQQFRASSTVEFSLNVEDNRQLRDLLGWFDGDQFVRIWYGDDIHLSIPVNFGDYKLEVSSVKAAARRPLVSGENVTLLPLPDSSTNLDYVAHMYPTSDYVGYKVPDEAEITNMARIALYAVNNVIPGKLDRFKVILTDDNYAIHYHYIGGPKTNFIVPAKH